MSDPTLKRTSVAIKYTASDGYRMEFTGKGGTGTVHRVTGEQVPPKRAFLEAVGELARIATIFGFEAEAKVEFERAVDAVKAWKEEV